MSGEGASALQRAVSEGGPIAGYPVAIAYCCASEDGTRMFTARDIPALAAKPFACLEALGDAVMGACGMDTTVEDAEKN